MTCTNCGNSESDQRWCKDCRLQSKREVRALKKQDGYVDRRTLRKKPDEVRKTNQKVWIEANKEKLADYHKEYRRVNKDKLAANKLAEAHRAKAEGIAEYGGCCACCGESQIEFLTIDHINGRQDEKRRMTGKALWLHLKWNGFPKDNIQLLCYNCNCAKGVYGVCPHKLTMI